MDAPCQSPRCRQPGVLIYLGRDVCCGCWQKLSDADPAAELELLSKLDLTRTAQGEVVEQVAGQQTFRSY